MNTNYVAGMFVVLCVNVRVCACVGSNASCPAGHIQNTTCERAARHYDDKLSPKCAAVLVFVIVIDVRASDIFDGHTLHT